MVRRSSTETFQRLEGIRDRPDAAHRATCSTSARWSTCSAPASRDEIYNLAAMSFVAASWNAAGADRRVHRRRRHADARGDARGRARGALLPGLLVARCSARSARCRRTRARRSTRAAPTASPRPTATSSPSTTARATASSPARGSSSTTKSPRRGLEFVTRKVTHAAAAIKLGLQRRAGARQPRRRARLGLRHATTSRPCG